MISTSFVELHFNKTQIHIILTALYYNKSYNWSLYIRLIWNRYAWNQRKRWFLLGHLINNSLFSRVHHSVDGRNSVLIHKSSRCSFDWFPSQRPLRGMKLSYREWDIAGGVVEGDDIHIVSNQNEQQYGQIQNHEERRKRRFERAYEIAAHSTRSRGHEERNTVVKLVMDSIEALNSWM